MGTIAGLNPNMQINASNSSNNKKITESLLTDRALGSLMCLPLAV